MTATEKEEKIKNTFGSFTTFGGPSFNWLGHQTLTHTKTNLYLVDNYCSDWIWRLANPHTGKRNGAAKYTKKWQTWQNEICSKKKKKMRKALWLVRQQQRHTKWNRSWKEGVVWGGFERFDTGDSWKARRGEISLLLWKTRLKPHTKMWPLFTSHDPLPFSSRAEKFVSQSAHWCIGP